MSSVELFWAVRPDCREAVWIRKGQWAKERAVRDAEDGSRGPDPQRDRDDRDRGKRRTPSE